MNKGLDLHICRDPQPYPFNLLQRQLPGRYHPLSPKAMPKLIRPIICIVGLSADVDIHIRQHPFRRHKYSGIRDDKGVRPYCLKLLKIPLHLFQILVVSQDIGRNVHLYSPAVGKTHALPHILQGKIVGLCPQPEGLPADIHRIRPVDHSGFQHIQASRRHQKFRLSHPAFLSVFFLISTSHLTAVSPPHFHPLQYRAG